MNNLLPDNFLIYKIANSNLYAAIPNNFSRLIREIVMEYKKLELVPNGRAVKGILFKKSSINNYELADQGLEKNIEINSLQFATEVN